MYCTKESDSHSVFLELSCLLFDGTPQLHFANFLHMIKIMAESGATEEQTEFFILNSQKMAKLPDEESRWSLESISSLSESKAVPVASDSTKVDAPSSSKSKKRKRGVKSSNWPPVGWKTAPGFDSVCATVPKTPGSNSAQIQGADQTQDSHESEDVPLNDISSNQIDVKVDSTGQAAVLAVTEVPEFLPNLPSNLMEFNLNAVADPVDIVSPDRPDFGLSVSNENDEVLAQQALLTGRLGEFVAFKYFMGAEEAGGRPVKWVNEVNETGLPYDILLEGDDENTEYIEVKATRYGRKNWFLISINEWQFAIEKGEAFSIAHVILTDDNMARVTVYKNPARLCQLGNLRLAVVVPKQ